MAPNQLQDDPNSLAGAIQGLLHHPGSWYDVDMESQPTHDGHVKPSCITLVKLSQNEWNLWSISEVILFEA